MSKKPIPFPGKYKPPGAVTPKIVYDEAVDWRACDHQWGLDYIVDEATGTVTCGACKEKLNPIWVLKHLSFLIEENNRRLARRRKKDG